MREEENFFSNKSISMRTNVKNAIFWTH